MYIGTSNLMTNQQEKGLEWDELTLHSALSFSLISLFEHSFDMLRTSIWYVTINN